MLKQMGFGCLVVLGLCLGVSSNVEAQSRVRYTGAGKTRVTLVWQAWGCAGIKSGITRACHSTTIGPNETKTYKFKKLTSKRKVHLMCGYSTYSYNKNTSNSKTHTISVSNGHFTFDGTSIRKDCTAP